MSLAILEFKLVIAVATLAAKNDMSLAILEFKLVCAELKTYDSSYMSLAILEFKFLKVRRWKQWDII